jgi:hypothetical protein
VAGSNDQVTGDATWYAWDKQRKYVIGDHAGRPIGRMDAVRWRTFVDQLNQLGVIDQRFDPADLYTNDYLPADVVAPDPATLPTPPPGSYVGQT